jgi:hypothetical protein
MNDSRTVRGERAIHTQTVEGFWSIFRKYMPLYVAELQCRHNNRGGNADIFAPEIDADLADSGSRARPVPNIDRGFGSSIKVAVPTT